MAEASGRWCLPAAAVLDHWAAACEAAHVVRWVDRALHFAVQPDPRPEARDGRDQRTGVGVSRSVEDGCGVAAFDDLAEVHHRHTVGQQANDVEVVADEERGQLQFAAQPVQQLQHDRLH
jgi:hypothetical protein